MGLQAGRHQQRLAGEQPAQRRLRADPQRRQSSLRGPGQPPLRIYRGKGGRDAARLGPQQRIGRPRIADCRAWQRRRSAQRLAPRPRGRRGHGRHAAQIRRLRPARQAGQEVRLFAGQHHVDGAAQDRRQRRGQVARLRTFVVEPDKRQQPVEVGKPDRHPPGGRLAQPQRRGGGTHRVDERTDVEPGRLVPECRQVQHEARRRSRLAAAPERRRGRPLALQQQRVQPVRQRRIAFEPGAGGERTDPAFRRTRQTGLAVAGRQRGQRCGCAVVPTRRQGECAGGGVRIGASLGVAHAYAAPDSGKAHGRMLVRFAPGRNRHPSPNRGGPGWRIAASTRI